MKRKTKKKYLKKLHKQHRELENDSKEWLEERGLGGGDKRET